MRSARKSRLLLGFGFLVVGVAVVATWAVYAAVSSRAATGLEIKDRAAISVLPLSLSLICMVWGAVLIYRAARH
jgi:hypothetical protein